MFKLALRNLPAAFDRMTVAFLSDTHHGPFVPLSYLAEVVEMTNALRPDVILLGGDYVQRRKGLSRFRRARRRGNRQRRRGTRGRSERRKAASPCSATTTTGRTPHWSGTPWQRTISRT